MKMENVSIFKIKITVKALAILLLVFCAQGFFPTRGTAQPVSPGGVPILQKVAGEVRAVELKRGDTLIALSARHGVRVENIMRDNDITDPRALRIGQTVKIDTRRIIPELTDNGLVADIAAAMLYRFDGAALVARYPAGFGSQARQTPTGTFTILFADHDPSWRYPMDVMEEKSREAQIVRHRTPPSKELSLGPYWIQLSTWGMGIHPTPFPSTIGRFMGHTHIKISEENAAELSSQLKPGTRLESVYHPVRLAITADGAIWAEAHPDIYGLGLPTEDEILKALGENAAGVDLEKLRLVMADSYGIATEVGQIKMAQTESEQTVGTEDSSFATWSCIDCPPGPDRRITLRIEALQPITLANDFPMEVRDDAGRTVYQPEAADAQPILLGKGESRNLVWECNDSEGQPLPQGSYSALITFIGTDKKEVSLSVPVWLGQ